MSALTTCTRCGRLRPHYALGQCQGCYDHSAARRVRGTRPRSRVRGARNSEPDTVAIDQVISGAAEPAALTAAELRAAVAVLTRDGRSANEIGRRLGISQRHVVRLRAQLRKGGA